MEKFRVYYEVKELHKPKLTKSLLENSILLNGFQNQVGEFESLKEARHFLIRNFGDTNKLGTEKKANRKGENFYIAKYAVIERVIMDESGKELDSIVENYIYSLADEMN